jgi:hypothetical protein
VGAWHRLPVLKYSAWRQRLRVGADRTSEAHEQRVGGQLVAD